MIIEQLLLMPFGTNCYIVGDEATKEAMVNLDVEGDKVIVNTKYGYSSADSGGDEPVVMIFTLDDKKETKKGSKK